jgi:hypothetical protein
MKRLSSFFLAIIIFSTSSLAGAQGNEVENVVKNDCPFLKASDITDTDFKTLRASFSKNVCELQATLKNCNEALKEMNGLKESNTTPYTCEKVDNKDDHSLFSLKGTSTDTSDTSFNSSFVSSVAQTLIADRNKITCRNLESSLINLQDDYWNSYFKSDFTVANAEKFFDASTRIARREKYAFLQAFTTIVPGIPSELPYTIDSTVITLENSQFGISNAEEAKPQEIFSSCHSAFSTSMKSLFSAIDRTKLENYLNSDGYNYSPEDAVGQVLERIEGLEKEKEELNTQNKNLAGVDGESGQIKTKENELAALDIEEVRKNLNNLNVKIVDINEYRAKLSECAKGYTNSDEKTDEQKYTDICSSCFLSKWEGSSFQRVQVCNALTTIVGTSTTITNLTNLVNSALNGANPQIRLLEEQVTKAENIEREITILKEKVDSNKVRISQIEEELKELDEINAGTPKQLENETQYVEIVIDPMIAEIQDIYNTNKDLYQDCMRDKMIQFRDFAENKCNDKATFAATNADKIAENYQAIDSLLTGPKDSLQQCLDQLERKGQSEHYDRVIAKHRINNASEVVSSVATIATSIIPTIDPLTRSGIQAASKLQEGIFQGGSRKLKKELSDLRNMLNNITEQSELIPSYKCNFYSFNRLLAKEKCSQYDNDDLDIFNASPTCPYVVARSDVFTEIKKLAKSIEEYGNDKKEDDEKEIDPNIPMGLVSLIISNEEANLDKLLPHLIEVVGLASSDLNNRESSIINSNRNDVLNMVKRFKSLQKVIDNIPRDTITKITPKVLFKGVTEDEKKLLYNVDSSFSLDRFYEVYMQLKPVTKEEIAYHNTLKNIKYEQIYSKYRDELEKSFSGLNVTSAIRKNANLYKGGFMYLYGEKLKEDFVKSACNISGLGTGHEFDNDIENLMKMCVHNQSVFFYNVDIDGGEINKTTNQGGADFFNEVCNVFRHEECQNAGLRMPASCEKNGDRGSSWTDEDIRMCEETHYNLYCNDRDYQDIDTMLGMLKQNQTGKYFCGMSNNEIDTNVRQKIKDALVKYEEYKESEFNGCEKDRKGRYFHSGSEAEPGDLNLPDQDFVPSPKQVGA